MVPPAPTNNGRLFGLTIVAPRARNATGPGPMPAILPSTAGSLVSVRLRQFLHPDGE